MSVAPLFHSCSLLDPSSSLAHACQELGSLIVFLREGRPVTHLPSSPAGGGAGERLTGRLLARRPPVSRLSSSPAAGGGGGGERLTGRLPARRRPVSHLSSSPTGGGAGEWLTGCLPVRRRPVSRFSPAGGAARKVAHLSSSCAKTIGEPPLLLARRIMMMMTRRRSWRRGGSPVVFAQEDDR